MQLPPHRQKPRRSPNHPCFVCKTPLSVQTATFMQRRKQKLVIWHANNTMRWRQTALKSSYQLVLSIDLAIIAEYLGNPLAQCTRPGFWSIPNREIESDMASKSGLALSRKGGGVVHGWVSGWWLGEFCINLMFSVINSPSYYHSRNETLKLLLPIRALVFESVDCGSHVPKEHQDTSP